MKLFPTTATFIIPHWSDGSDRSFEIFEETLESIFRQTDTDWNMVIIDDCSPEKAINRLRKIQFRQPKKIHLIENTINRGAGACRNIGVAWAMEKLSPFVLFCDSDDISSESRLHVVRSIFDRSPRASVVYHPFKIIDEYSNLVELDSVTPNILETIEVLENSPPQGNNVWIDIATKTGYINLTSATSVRTMLAYQYPFPSERVSEDSNTWMRYAAGGEEFVFSRDAHVHYRIPQGSAGSASRSREGGKSAFYEGKVRVDSDGFTRAMEIAVTKQSIDLERRDYYQIGFYLKLAETVFNEDQNDLALELLQKAKGISCELTSLLVRENGHSYWAGE